MSLFRKASKKQIENKVEKQSEATSNQNLCPHCGTRLFGNPIRCYKCHNLVEEKYKKDIPKKNKNKHTPILEGLEYTELKPLLEKIYIGMSANELKQLIGDPNVTVGTDEMLNIFDTVIGNPPKSEIGKANWLYETQYESFQLIMKGDKIVDISDLKRFLNKIGKW